MWAAAVGVLQAVPFLEAVHDQRAAKRKLGPTPPPCTARAAF